MEERFKIRIEILDRDKVVVRETKALKFNPDTIPRSYQAECFDMAIDQAISMEVGMKVKQGFRALHAVCDFTGPLPALPPTSTHLPSPSPGIIGIGIKQPEAEILSPSPPTTADTFSIEVSNNIQLQILKNTLTVLDVKDYVLEAAAKNKVTTENPKTLKSTNSIAICRIPVGEKVRIRYIRIPFHSLHLQLYTKLLGEIQDQLIGNPAAHLPQMADVSHLGRSDPKYKDFIVDTFNPILCDKIFSKQIFLKEKGMLPHLETILRDVRENIELIGYQGLNEYRVWADIANPESVPEEIQAKIRRIISPLKYTVSKYMFHEGLEIAECKEFGAKIRGKYAGEIEVKYGSKKIYTDGRRIYRYKGKGKNIKEEERKGIIAIIESLNIGTNIQIEMKLKEKTKNCIVKQQLYIENFITKPEEKRKLRPMCLYNLKYSVLENIQRELGGKFEMIEDKIFFQGKICQLPRATKRILEFLYEFTMETIMDIKFPECLLAKTKQPETGKSLIEELEAEFRCICKTIKSGTTLKPKVKLEILGEKRRNIEDFKKEYFRRRKELAIYNKPMPFIKDLDKQKSDIIIEQLKQTFGVIVAKGKPPWVIYGPSEYSVTEALAKYEDELAPTKIETIKKSISVNPINYGVEIINQLKSSGFFNNQNIFVHVNHPSKSIDLSSKIYENIQNAENKINEQMSTMKAQIKEINLNPKTSYFINKNEQTMKLKTGIFTFLRYFPLIYIYFAKSEKKVAVEEVKEGKGVRTVNIGVWYFHVWEEMDINYQNADAQVGDKRYKLFNEVHQEQLNGHYQRWVEAGQPQNYERRLYQDKYETIPEEFKAVLDPNPNNWYEVNIKYNTNKRHLVRGEKIIEEPIPTQFQSIQKKERETQYAAVIRGTDTSQIEKVKVELEKLVQKQESKEVQIDLSYRYTALPDTERQKIEGELAKIYVNILRENAQGVVIRGLNIEKSKYILEEYENSIKRHSYPNEWENTIELDNKKATLYRLHNASQEFKFCHQQLVATLENAIILSVDRIQSKRLWKKYEDERLQLSETRGEDDPTVQKETYLFHGTGNIYIYIYIYIGKTLPEVIYNSEEGLDMSFCGGIWGQGIYLAKESKHSNGSSFVHIDPVSGNRVLLLVKARLGDSYMSHGDRSLRLPPQKPDSDDRYDSVSSQGKNIYIVYKNSKVYPQYLINYKT